MEASGHIDVVAEMALVKAQTLVLHPRGDAIVPFDQGRMIAAGIAGAKFVALESRNHLLIENEPSWHRFVSAVGEFLEWKTEVAVAPGAADARGADSRSRYEFLRCVLDPLTRELHRSGRLVPIEQRAFNLLLYLVEHRDRAVSKDELQSAIWPRMILTESALTRCIMKARRAVGDDSERQAVIKTVHGHGYRFVAPLTGASRPASG
jgi:DNA-binding winged helix-turn-helix (wHTH) protein